MHRDNATERWNVLEVGCLRMAVPAVSLSPISQIAVVQGLVRCASAALLLSRGSDGDSGKYVRDTIDLLIFIYRFIHRYYMYDCFCVFTTAFHNNNNNSNRNSSNNNNNDNNINSSNNSY